MANRKCVVLVLGFLIIATIILYKVRLRHFSDHSKPSSSRPHNGNDNVQVMIAGNRTTQQQLSTGYFSLSRLGSDLKFDLESCPPGSEMARSVFSPPIHNDCPTLFIVGARKGGSTSLLQYVSSHPDFQGGCLKCRLVGEIFYFSHNFDMQAWDQYLSHFPPDVPMTGESSVAYLVNCDTPRRIFKLCGKQAKIVMLFRNPIDRLVSNFLMRARVGGNYGDDTISPNITMSTPIHDVVVKELNAYSKQTAQVLANRNLLPPVVNESDSWLLHKCKFDPGRSLIFEGMYYMHLMNWICNFPAENILIINSEEFYIDTSKILKQVVHFLGLSELEEEEYKNITSKVYNQGVYDKVLPHQQLSQSDREKLHKVFRPSNEAIKEILHWNTVSWN